MQRVDAVLGGVLGQLVDEMAVVVQERGGDEHRIGTVLLRGERGLQHVLEVRGRVGAQRLGDAEAVDERALAASGARRQAVQQLQRWNRLAVGIVGVRPEAARRVGEVGRLDDRAHVGHAAVVRHAHVAEQLCDSRDLAALDGDAEENAEAESGDPFQPPPQLSRVGHHVGLTRRAAAPRRCPHPTAGALPASRRARTRRSQPPA